MPPRTPPRLRGRYARTPSPVQPSACPSFDVGNQLMHCHMRRSPQLTKWRCELVLLWTAFELAERLPATPVTGHSEAVGIIEVSRQCLSKVPRGLAYLLGNRTPLTLEIASTSILDLHM